jgi:heme/copper-type cytochrome/quinol oxidase subunit 1
MPVTGQLFFMYATIDRGTTGVKAFNWVATMWKGSPAERRCCSA